jgi:hypothetical protein
MGPLIEDISGEKHCLLFIDEMSRKAFIRVMKSRAQVSAATMELMRKEQRKTQATLVYLRDNGAKEYNVKALLEFLRQVGITHEITVRYCPQ